ncbi:resistin-like beta [Arvicola amphibius]|uniref:resistin-like beta n=1 Tax=Arvicola amphibius TaxID=1047088 RepID=UPI0018E3154A|nr:resistin-like beta [Arvicola amphibius]
MKSTIWFLLIFISLLHLTIPVNTQASKDSSVNKKIQEALNGGEPKKLSCMSVTTSGSWSSCPAGMAVTGCACGKGCGSWDIQNGITCHCQCTGMDWTNARCCQLV